MSITSAPVRQPRRTRCVAEASGDTETVDLRPAARGLACTVAVVSVSSDEKVLAKTVSSFTTVSLAPALVSVWVGSASPVLHAAAAARAFTISVLDVTQQQVASAFSEPGSGRRDAADIGIAMASAPSGAAIVGGCLSWFDCRVDALVDSGDHTLLIGAVAATGRRAGEPLVYHDGQYRGLSRTTARAGHREEPSRGTQS